MKGPRTRSDRAPTGCPYLRGPPGRTPVHPCGLLAADPGIVRKLWKLSFIHLMRRKKKLRGPDSGAEALVNLTYHFGEGGERVHAGLAGELGPTGGLFLGEVGEDVWGVGQGVKKYAGTVELFHACPPLTPGRWVRRPRMIGPGWRAKATWDFPKSPSGKQGRAPGRRSVAPGGVFYGQRPRACQGSRGQAAKRGGVHSTQYLGGKGTRGGGEAKSCKHRMCRG